MIRRKHTDRNAATDELSAWIRQHPETWENDVAPLDQQRLDDFTQTVLLRAQQLSGLDAKAVRHHRRRRWIVGVSLSMALVTAGGVGVAALFRGGQPSKPQLGVVCQDLLGEGRNMIVLPATDDPIGDCSALWREGRFTKPGDSDISIPELTACISANGEIIQVQPLSLGNCGELGLREADEQLDAQSKQLVAFADRITEEVNLTEPCLNAAAASTRSQRVVDDFQLEGWRVEIRPDSVSATCTKAAVIVEQRTVQIAQYNQ